MRFLHLADLHIGKRLNEFNLIEDQRHILEQIIGIAEEQKVEAILIAGDVYDRSQPSAEAVELLDDFLTRLTDLGLLVFLISGNHDSGERLSFGNRILAKRGLHIAGCFNGTLEKITIQDQYGPLHIHLLPFLRPPHVRPFFVEKIETYDEAIRQVLATTKIDLTKRNVLLAHQFVVSGSQEPERSDSETISIGGLDAVDASAFRGFDYVALGHLHRPQCIGVETIRYGGSPLKYSFSEARQEKSALIVDLGSKGELEITAIPLLPLRDLREIKGPIREILQLGAADPGGHKDYVKITLTDQEEVYDALGQLRTVYPNLMALDFERNALQKSGLTQTAVTEDLQKISPLELFAGFYKLQNGEELTEGQAKILVEVLKEAGGEIL